MRCSAREAKQRQRDKQTLKMEFHRGCSFIRVCNIASPHHAEAGRVAPLIDLFVFEFVDRPYFAARTS
jgi:hypothetical protein